MTFRVGQSKPVKGGGAAIRWLRDHVAHEGDACLPWPFFRDRSGYGRLGFEGRIPWAHRMMCELAHGPVPEGHQASHSCGRGNHGCVNPRHLSWKTASANHLDRRRHGTAATSRYGPRPALSQAQRAEVLALKDKKTQIELAEMYGVNRRTIQRITMAG